MNRVEPIWPSTRLVAAFVVVASGLFFWISLISGYGYDALEYLVLARSLVDGYAFYDFIPSKSFGLYYGLAGWLHVGVGDSRVELAVLITLIYTACLCGTFVVGAQLFNRRVGLYATALVALYAPFMEMNYLEPEGFVFLSGLAAIVCLSRWREGRTLPLFLAGMWIGVGFAFKSVAGFYYLGAVAFVFIMDLRRARAPLAKAIRHQCMVLAGMLASLAVPMLYFSVTGRLAEHIEWTYTFPLFHRPADTFWVSKFLTKLLWVIVIHAVVLGLSLREDVRSKLYGDANVCLVLCFGVAALLVLLKQQASHYAFPSAGVLSLWMAASVDSLGPRLEKSRAKAAFVITAVGMVIVVFASILMYRPAVLARLVRPPDTGWEESVRDYFAGEVKKGDRTLFFNKSTLLYWLSGTYPVIPLVKIDVQESYIIRRQPQILEASLDNEQLDLVEFNPEWIGIQDREFLKNDGQRQIMKDFEKRLRSEFAVAETGVAPFMFWQRIEGDAVR